MTMSSFNMFLFLLYIVIVLKKQLPHRAGTVETKRKSKQKKQIRTHPIKQSIPHTWRNNLNKNIMNHTHKQSGNKQQKTSLKQNKWKSQRPRPYTANQGKTHTKSNIQHTLYGTHFKLQLATKLFFRCFMLCFCGWFMWNHKDQEIKCEFRSEVMPFSAKVLCVRLGFHKFPWGHRKP